MGFSNFLRFCESKKLFSKTDPVPLCNSIAVAAGDTLFDVINNINFALELVRSNP